MCQHSHVCQLQTYSDICSEQTTFLCDCHVNLAHVKLTTWKSRCVLLASLFYYSAYEADTYKHIPIYTVNKLLSFVIAMSTSPMWDISRLFLGNSWTCDLFNSGYAFGE